MNMTRKAGKNRLAKTNDEQLQNDKHRKKI